MKEIEGSYALVILTDNKLIGVRDVNGIRPLCIGKRDDSYFLASESCAFDVAGAELIRDVEAGEIVEGLKRSVGLDLICAGCFDGNYSSEKIKEQVYNYEI